jgi:2'-5' RNA ligase
LVSRAGRRLAVYVLPPAELAELVQAKMDLVFTSNALLGDTRDVVGGAALYPPHITIKGAFRLTGARDADEVEAASRLSSGLEETMTTTPAFAIRTERLENHPGDSISIVFDRPSVSKLRELQALVVAVVDKVRAPILEPNYQDAGNDATSLRHGEPQIGDDFVPHITVVGGKPGGLSPHQVQQVRRLLGEDWCRDWVFEVDRIGLLSEARLNGCWSVERYYPLRGR